MINGTPALLRLLVPKTFKIKLLKHAKNNLKLAD